jgi:predicted RNase H-like nuclease (RuvC/YqgF family)
MMDDLKKINEDLEMKIKKLEKEKEKLIDEVESLWGMMDEMTKTDIKNWAHLTSDLEIDILTRALMISKKKVDA